MSRYTTTRFLAGVLSTRHFIVKCSQRRTDPRLIESLVKVPHETFQCEVFSTEDLRLHFGVSLMGLFSVVKCSQRRCIKWIVLSFSVSKFLRRDSSG